MQDLPWVLVCWVGVLCWFQPVDNQCCGWTGSYDCNALTSPGKHSLIAPCLIEYLGPHRELEGEEERGGMWAWGGGPAFIGVEGGVLVFCRLTLLVNLNLKVPSQMGSLSSCVAGNVLIRDSHLWNGCLSNQSLSQALALPKSRNQLSGLTRQSIVDAEASASMMRTLAAWVADTLKVRGRIRCNPESAYLNRI